MSDIHKIYISGPLTGVPDLQAYRKFYEDLAGVCARLSLQAYVPHKNSDPFDNPDLSPAEVYRMDRAQVEAADLVIAYLGMPSVGVGMELEIAHQRGIPVLLLIEAEVPVSRMARGCPVAAAELCFTDHAEALRKVRDWLQEYVYDRV